MKPLIWGIKRSLDQSDSTDDDELLMEDEKNYNNKLNNVEMEKPMTSENYAVELGLVPSDSLNDIIQVPEASNSPLLVPLNLGWRREMVHDAKATRIRYYMPSGQRLSSVKEVNRALKAMGSSLTPDNFSFERKILGVNDMAKEIVRKSIPRKPGSKKRQPASLKSQRRSLETIEILSKQPSHSTDTTTRKSLPARIQQLSMNDTIKLPEASNSPLLVPLNLGWRRDMVHNTKDTRIRYYTPSDKRLSSMKEVNRALKKMESSLTPDNFSFERKSLSVNDGKKEIVRKSIPKTPGMKKSIDSTQMQVSVTPSDTRTLRRKNAESLPPIMTIKHPASVNSERKSLETIEISSNQPSHSADTSKRKSLRAHNPKLSTSSEIKVRMSDVSPFLVPLNMGWRREVVHRSNSSRFDIYYRTPSGKKLRSLAEVKRALKETQSTLTVENFSFKLNSLGIDDPIKEEIRHASGQNVSLTTSTEKVSKKNQRESLPASPPPTKKAKLTVAPEDKLSATPKVRLIRMSQVESIVTPKAKSTVTQKDKLTVTPEDKLSAIPKVKLIRMSQVESIVSPKAKSTVAQKEKLTVTPEDKLTATPKVKLIRMSQVESTVTPKVESTVKPKAKSTNTSKAATSTRSLIVKFPFLPKKLKSTSSATKMSSVPALLKSTSADSTKKKKLPPPPIDIAAKMKIPPTPKSLPTVDCLCEPDTITPETIYSKWGHGTSSGCTQTAQMCNPNTPNSLVDDSQRNIDDYFQLDGLVTIEELPAETDNITT